jgi:uncharacterized protein (UPF0332 family)/predicted nucleotidyltransferase
MTSAPPVHPAIAGDADWQRATREYIDVLRAHFGERLHAIVLFGSRARGDAHETESDVDLLVVLNGEFDRRTEQEAVSRLKRQAYDEGFILFGLIASAYNYRKEMLPIYMNIRREGFELWPVPSHQVREERREYGKAGKGSVETVLKLARETLDSADFILGHHSARAAVNRAYYVMFHAATALLLSEGLAFSKHQGVISGFREHFIKTGKLPVEMSHLIGDAFDARNAADYEYDSNVSEEQATEQVRLAHEFLAASERYLGLQA